MASRQAQAFRLDERVVVVTGAGKGIGRACCSLFSSLGADVVAVSRSQKDLDSLQAEVAHEASKEAGGRRGRVIRLIVADLSTIEECERAAREAFLPLQDGFPPTLLVNNAGISTTAPIGAVSWADWDKMMAVNVRAAAIFTQTLASANETSGGALVNVSSQAAVVGLADHAAYCASKGALDQLTRVTALELGPRGIRANSVQPTVVLTEMGLQAWGDPAKAGPMLSKIPLGHFAEPLDVAYTVAFLLSGASKMITGTTIPVDGGFLAGR